MKILLDTHAFLWLMVDDPKLSSKAKMTFRDPSNDFYLSMASVWEMAIKSSLKKLKLPLPIGKFIDTRTQSHGIKLLEITLKYISMVETLPFHYRDPFDRLIISQGLFEKLPILTKDKMFDAYPVERVW